MPTLLHNVAGSDDGIGSDGIGWTIRRADGTPLATDKSLAAQEVPDGEVLRLVSRDEDWPEPDYDDIVLAVADGTRLLGTQWNGAATRRAGLLAASLLLLGGAGLLLASGPPWRLPAVGALAVAAALLIGGAVLSRAAGDSGAGGALGAVALPYALVGGLLILAGPDAGFGAPHLLLGCVALLLAGVVGFVAVADWLWLFVAAIVVALLGSLVALLAVAGLDTPAAWSVTVAVALAVMPATTVLSIRLSKLPMPDLPQTAQDLLDDGPLPSRERIFAAVVRADEFFAGIILGLGAAALVAVLVLGRAGGLAAPLLAAIVALLLLFRSRSLDRPRQRVALLVSGVAGLAVVAVGGADRSVLPMLVFAGLVPAALLALAVGLRYSRRRPGPQLGRLADIAEFLLGASVVPLVAAVLGLFGYVRGLGG